MIFLGGLGVYGILFGRNSLEKLQIENKKLSTLYEINYNINSLDNIITYVIDETKVSSKGYYKIRYNNITQQIQEKINVYEDKNYTKDINNYFIKLEELINIIDNKNYIEANEFYKKEITNEKITIEEKSSELLKKHSLNVNILSNKYNDESNIIIVLNLIMIIIAILLSYFLLIKLKEKLSRQLKNISSYAKALGEGNLNYRMKDYYNDEIGEVIEELNLAIESIKNILNQTKKMVYTSNENSENNVISSDKIKKTISLAKKDTLNTSDKVAMLNDDCETAACKIQEIIAVTKVISKEIIKNSNNANDMSKKAIQIEKLSLKSVENAFNIFETKSKHIELSLERGKIIKEIESMLKIINSIFKQINLLAINASIEAAKAENSGHGFSIIAEEIRKLSDETELNLKNVKETILSVISVFNDISRDSKDLVKYLNSKVKDDYNLLIDISKSYGEDMKLLSEESIKINNLTENIFAYMGEIGEKIENIAISTSDILSNSKDTNSDMCKIEEFIKGLGDSIENEKIVLNKLNLSLNNFII
ncbi:methyl-accepting chemotaxis protein [Clostridium sartagoforme]|jgi:methyl-accepting chemotaxis protein